MTKYQSKLETIAFRVLFVVAIILISAAFNGCTKFSKGVMDASAGFNGSFENLKSGLPVNWAFHSTPIKNGDVEISLDTKDTVEGKQSLKFIVNRADPIGGWRAPGLFQVRPAKPQKSYKVSFWLKNQGSKISLIVRNEGKDPLFGPSKAVKKDLADHPPIRKILGEEETGVNKWRQFEFIYAFPEMDDRIRFELNIIKPGTLWLDDVRIEEVGT